MHADFSYISLLKTNECDKVSILHLFFEILILKFYSLSDNNRSQLLSHKINCKSKIKGIKKHPPSEQRQGRASRAGDVFFENKMTDMKMKQCKTLCGTVNIKIHPNVFAL